jgi:hypothetical protein
MAPVCPQLYLYSDADPLAPPHEVEAFMKQQVMCSLAEARVFKSSCNAWVCVTEGSA